MPEKLVLAHVRALPRLEAEESLTAVTRHQVGGGLLKRADSSRVLGNWQRLVRRATGVSEMSLRGLIAQFGRLSGVKVAPAKRGGSDAG